MTGTTRVSPSSAAYSSHTELTAPPGYKPRDWILLQRPNAELAVAYDATSEGWSRALDLRDKETEGHTQRVTETKNGPSCASILLSLL